MSKIQIAPSLLSADFSKLGDEVRTVVDGGAEILHMDVMDGHFVPNITFGPFVVEAVRKVTDKPIDVHLMIENPERYVAEFVAAGATMISVHYETCPHLHRTIQFIRNQGAKAGVALNPSTPVAMVAPVLADVDFVLVMSVNPGFSGQRFIPQCLDKVRVLRRMIEDRKLPAVIEIDGGITLTNIHQAADAGVAIAVAGSAVFGTYDPAAEIERLKKAATGKVKISPTVRIEKT